MKGYELLQQHDDIQEEAYVGNLGFVEMLKFMKVASKADLSLMKRLLDADQFAKAWDLLKRVTGAKLKPLKGK